MIKDETDYKIARLRIQHWLAATNIIREADELQWGADFKALQISIYEAKMLELQLQVTEWERTHPLKYNA